MITITKKVTQTIPKLKIIYDESPESPREWENLGYFITKERNYSSPDGKEYPHIQKIIETTGDIADNAAEHIQLITNEINQTGETVKVIYPIYRYEHGNVSYKRGTASGFDYSNNGFYIVTEKTQAILGTPDELIEKVIDGELEMYTKYVNGGIYGFELLDNNGDFEDSCYGFYDIEDIRECLPAEYKDDDLHDYLKY
jgi:hypothetical protein